MNFSYDSSLTTQQRQWIADAIQRCRYPFDRLPEVTAQFIAVDEPPCTGHKEAACTQDMGVVDYSRLFHVHVRNTLDSTAAVNEANFTPSEVKRFFQECVIHELGHVIHMTLIDTDDLKTEVATWFTRDGDLGEGEPSGTLDDWDDVLMPWGDRIQEAVAETVKDAALDTTHRLYDNRANWRLKDAQFGALMHLLAWDGSDGGADNDRFDLTQHDEATFPGTLSTFSGPALLQDSYNGGVDGVLAALSHMLYYPADADTSANFDGLGATFSPPDGIGEIAPPLSDGDPPRWHELVVAVPQAERLKYQRPRTYHGNIVAKLHITADSSLTAEQAFMVGNWNWNLARAGSNFVVSQGIDAERSAFWPLDGGGPSTLLTEVNGFFGSQDIFGHERAIVMYVDDPTHTDDMTAPVRYSYEQVAVIGGQSPWGFVPVWGEYPEGYPGGPFPTPVPEDADGPFFHVGYGDRIIYFRTRAGGYEGQPWLHNDPLTGHLTLNGWEDAWTPVTETLTNVQAWVTIEAELIDAVKPDYPYPPPSVSVSQGPSGVMRFSLR